MVIFLHLNLLVSKQVMSQLGAPIKFAKEHFLPVEMGPIARR